MAYIYDQSIENNPDFTLGTFERFGGNQLFSSATSVYLVTPDLHYIVLHQTKNNRVVGDNVVGIGGKTGLSTLYDDNAGEKVNMETIITSIMTQSFKINDIDETAVREVFEETGGYNEDGTLSGYGIKLSKDKLIRIGNSIIGLNNEKGSSCFGIQYYVYFLNGTEGQISPKEQREGYFSQHTYEELMQLQMLPAERVILQMQDPRVSVEALYDDLNNIYKLRTVYEAKDRNIRVLVPDLRIQHFIGKEYQKRNVSDAYLRSRGLSSRQLEEYKKIPEILEAYKIVYGDKMISEFSYPNIKFPETPIEETPYLSLTPFKTETQRTKTFI
jgi:hypothetical protein